MEFKDSLQQIMEEKNMSAAELSRLSKVTEASISYYLSGAQIPTAKTVGKLASALGVTADRLIQTEFADEPAAPVYDEEALEYLEELRTRPEMKMLFKTAKNATKEDIEQAVKIIEAIRK